MNRFPVLRDIALMICGCTRRASRRDMIGLCCVREIQLFEAVSKCRTSLNSSDSCDDSQVIVLGISNLRGGHTNLRSNFAA